MIETLRIYQNTENQDSHVNAVLQHVLYFEQDDFKMNPSTEHVYFSAYAAMHNEKAAYEALDLAIAEQES